MNSLPNLCASKILPNICASKLLPNICASKILTNNSGMNTINVFAICGFSGAGKRSFARYLQNLNDQRSSCQESEQTTFRIRSMSTPDLRIVPPNAFINRPIHKFCFDNHKPTFIYNQDNTPKDDICYSIDNYNKYIEEKNHKDELYFSLPVEYAIKYCLEKDLDLVIPDLRRQKELDFLTDQEGKLPVSVSVFRVVRDQEQHKGLESELEKEHLYFNYNFLVESL